MIQYCAQYIINSPSSCTCYRRHKPGELKAAASQAELPPGEDIFHEFSEYLSANEGPRIVLFGDSHMNHLKSFLANPGHQPEIYKAFGRVRYLAVGGTTWSKILSHIKGDRLTQYQYHLGDQWSTFVDGGCDTDYLVISLGANDVDKYFQKPSKHDDVDGRQLHPRQLDRDLNAEFNIITAEVRKVLEFISENIQVKQIYYIKIIRRHYWTTGARRLASWLDFHVVQSLKRRYRIKDIDPKRLSGHHYQFGSQILFGMLKTDITHLNSLGNKVLMSSIMRNLLNKWYIQNPESQKLCHNSSKKRAHTNRQTRILRLRKLWRSRQRKRLMLSV